MILYLSFKLGLSHSFVESKTRWAVKIKVFVANLWLTFWASMSSICFWPWEKPFALFAFSSLKSNLWSCGHHQFRTSVTSVQVQAIQAYTEISTNIQFSSFTQLFRQVFGFSTWSVWALSAPLQAPEALIGGEISNISTTFRFPLIA